MSAQSDKWKHFERLVAAVHSASDQGAEVQWNENIGGRQFDVTVRFQKGMYRYLTVVECKNYGKPVSVEKVDAFVTKAVDAHADRAVLASTSGFQQGAQDVARRHNVTLIHVTESSEIDLSMFRAEWAGVVDALHIQRVELEYADGARKQLSEQSNELTYYLQKIVLECGVERINVERILQLHAPALAGDKDVYKDHVVECPAGTCVIAPDDGEIPFKPVTRLHVRAGMTEARGIIGPVQFDPYLLVPDVSVKNLSTGEDRTFQQRQLAFGVNTKVEEGAFYEQPTLASFYYCDNIEGDIVRMYLVESFQFGQLVQSIFTMKIENQKYYVPISDKTVIQRLQRKLNDIRSRP